jgi:putative membrane protein
MKIIIARILLSAIAVLIIDFMLPGVHVSDNMSAIWVALLLAILNSTVRPVLVLLTLPVTIFSLGLFLFVINAGITLLASHWIPGFKVDGFWWAFLFSFLLAIVSSVLQNILLKGHKQHAD